MAFSTILQNYLLTVVDDLRTLTELDPEIAELLAL